MNGANASDGVWARPTAGGFLGNCRLQAGAGSIVIDRDGVPEVFASPVAAAAHAGFVASQLLDSLEDDGKGRAK